MEDRHYLMGKSTISMAIFNGYELVYQRVIENDYEAANVGVTYFQTTPFDIQTYSTGIIKLISNPGPQQAGIRLP